MLDAFYGDKELKPSEHETEDEKKARLGVTPELVKSYIEHSIKACQQFIDADELLDGTIHALVVKQPTNAQMAQDDQLVIDEPRDIQDENDTYFGAENPDFDDDDIELAAEDGDAGYMIDDGEVDGNSEHKSEE